MIWAKTSKKDGKIKCMYEKNMYVIRQVGMYIIKDKGLPETLKKRGQLVDYRNFLIL